MNVGATVLEWPLMADEVQNQFQSLKEDVHELKEERRTDSRELADLRATVKALQEAKATDDSDDKLRDLRVETLMVEKRAREIVAQQKMKE